jgi:hypothetical protein
MAVDDRLGEEGHTYMISVSDRAPFPSPMDDPFSHAYDLLVLTQCHDPDSIFLTFLSRHTDSVVLTSLPCYDYFLLTPLCVSDSFLGYRTTVVADPYLL